MKWRMILLAITGFSIPTAGCSLARMVLPSPETPAQKIVCVVQYHRLHPHMLLGEDGCGNRWIMLPDSTGAARCMYWNAADGVLMEIQCPAQGDTLAVE